MTNGWMWIIGIMLIGGFILQMTPLMFYLYAVFGVHLSILLISYLILRRETIQKEPPPLPRTYGNS